MSPSPEAARTRAGGSGRRQARAPSRRTRPAAPPDGTGRGGRGQTAPHPDPHDRPRGRPPCTTTSSPGPRPGWPRTPTRRPAPSSPALLDAGGRRRSSPPASPAPSSSAPPACAASSAPGPTRMNRVVVIRAAAGLAAYLQGTGQDRRPRRHRLRRPPQVRRLRPRHRRRDDRRGPARGRPPPPAAHARPGVRHPAPRRGRRRGGHRQPQPAARQRLQGLPRRRLADRAARPTPRSPPRSTRSRPLDDVPRPDDRLGDPRRRASWTPTWPVRTRSSPPAPPAPPARSTRRCTASAGRRCSPPSPAPASRRPSSSPSRPSPTRTSRPSPSPTRRSPARWTSPSRRPARRTPTWSSPTTRTPTAARWPSGPDGGRLADAARRRGRRAARRPPGRAGARAAPFAESIVSSSLLGRIAAKAGLPYEETLTGFKWIARVEGLRYGYEEALGYCVDPDGVRDKDGITAALLSPSWPPSSRSEGRTLLDLLDDLAVEHGLHATDQLSVRVEDLSRHRGRDARACASSRRPRSAGLRGHHGRGPDARARTAAAHRRPALHLLDGARVIVRPSGTEPKLKCYLEVVVPVADHADLPAARAKATDLLAAIKRDLSAAAGI